jgi:hypothetical protein
MLIEFANETLATLSVLLCPLLSVRIKGLLPVLWDKKMATVSLLDASLNEIKGAHVVTLITLNLCFLLNNIEKI